MIKSLITAITGVLLALLKDLFPAIKRLCELLCRAIHKFFNRERGKHKVNPSQCIPVRHPSFKKPDPLIYDQYYLMSLGLAVTWQNPDIQILHGGVPVASAYDLLTSTAYTIRARIWNGSTEGVCAGMPVAFSYLSFGIGTVSHFIGATSVNLGVKGSAQCPAFADMVWITPATPGHYCIQVSFFWIDDANPFNNLGQENTQVVKAASPADFAFTLRNPGPARREYRFEVDAFQLETPPCPDNGKSRQPAAGTPKGAPTLAANVPRQVLARNSRAAHPLPEGWSIVFNPAVPVLNPGQEIDVTATVNPDNGFHGTQPVNVHAFSGSELMGGVTIVVERA